MLMHSWNRAIIRVPPCPVLGMSFCCRSAWATDIWVWASSFGKRRMPSRYLSSASAWDLGNQIHLGRPHTWKLSCAWLQETSDNLIMGIFHWMRQRERENNLLSACPSGPPSFCLLFTVLSELHYFFYGICLLFSLLLSLSHGVFLLFSISPPPPLSSIHWLFVSGFLSKIRNLLYFFSLQEKNPLENGERNVPFAATDGKGGNDLICYKIILLSVLRPWLKKDWYNVYGEGEREW